MPRVGLSVNDVVDAAILIADAEGLAALTLARLALVLNVKPPSLYNDVECLDTLRAHLTAKALSLLLDATRDAMAGVAGRDALLAFGHTQRNFAKQHPGLWSAYKLPRSNWNEVARTAAEAYLALGLAVVRGYDFTKDDAVHATRALRSSVQGFVDLELGGGFGLKQNLDLSFSRLLKMLDAVLRQGAIDAES